MTAKLFFVIIGILPFYILILKVIENRSGVSFLRLSKFFYCGICATVPFTLLYRLGFDASVMRPYFGVLGTVFLLALFEEFLKFSIFYYLNDREHSRLYFYLILALGFAYAENVFYFLESYNYFFFNLIGFFGIFLRLFLDSFAHATFTAVHGAIFNLNVKSYLGLIVATFVHFIFNIFCQEDLMVLLPLLLFVSGLFVFRLSKYQKWKKPCLVGG